ncbi:GNAT family N-acetyltransferase [Nonomuraea sp. FMUSA5-5]|uniref:GNAT family N-acetyltransferase n=1 Tax=Nonomuraea composti TaxID=2720023 RepID=A0ABX1BI39_9ACTN|nr:GNAT family N-acetyltransferase [Nonomuraea sp. FMUSA5-5]NJP95997.1 GNAT family N-acetyltransferase [Nonomuraea sp. FMUSA5-5]
MSVRPAAEADMPAVRQVARHFGLPDGWPVGGDFLDAEREHGTLLVALAAPGEAAGFGGTLLRGDVTRLGDLFVLPGRQSSGVGRVLLARLLGEAGPRVTFASSDPRAVALYARSGLRPWCPLLYLTGRPVEGPPGPPARTVGPDEVAPLDAAVSGGDARVVRRDPRRHGARDGRRLRLCAPGRGPADDRAGRGIAPQDCAQAVVAALTATVLCTTAQVAVPGTHPLVPVLLGAGWRIADMDTFMADDAALAVIRPDR